MIVPAMIVVAKLPTRTVWGETGLRVEATLFPWKYGMSDVRKPTLFYHRFHGIQRRSTDGEDGSRRNCRLVKTGRPSKTNTSDGFMLTPNDPESL